MTSSKRFILTLLVAASFLTACAAGTDQAPIAPQAPAIASAKGSTEPQAPAPSPEPAPVVQPPAEPAPIHWQVNENFVLTSTDPRAKEKKYVLLTFDDGPDPRSTPAVLDVLKQEKVKALFFVTGYGAKNEGIVKRIAAEGHTIGTHTQTHPNLRELSKEQQRGEIAPVNETVERLTGKKVKYFRPPYGAFNDNTKAIVQEQGLQLINWTHGSGDWMNVPKSGRKDPQLIVADVLTEKNPKPGMTVLFDGAVILLHDVHMHTAEALPGIIKGLREKGYDFAIIQ